jgi:hypothetical protein
MKNDAIKSWPEFNSRFHQLKKAASLKELEILEPSILHCKQKQFETEICYLQNSVNIQHNFALHEINERIGILSSLRKKIIERTLEPTVPYEDNIFQRDEDFEDNHWEIQQFEFTSFVFTQISEELGRAFSPRMLVNRSMRSLENPSDTVYADAETHAHYVNEHLGVDIPIEPIDLIGATKNYIRCNFASSMDID